MANFLAQKGPLTTHTTPAFTWMGPWTRLFVSIALISSGLFIVAISYDVSRAGLPYADLIYWAGMLLQFIPATVVLLHKNVTRQEAIALVVILGFTLYLTKVLVNPITFAFSDEMQQWRSAYNSIEMQRLFVPNPILEVSPYYPGLQNVTHALVSLTGWNIHDAGVILIGALRIMLMLSLFLFFEGLSHSHRISGLSALLYMCNPAFLGWTSYYIYQSLALPLAFLALYCITRLKFIETPFIESATNLRFGFIVSILLMVPAITVTHHVTAILFAALVTLFAVGPSLWVKFNTTRNWHLLAKFARRISRWLSRRVALFWVLAREDRNVEFEKNQLGWLAILIMIFVFIWITYFASLTLTYLGDQIGGIIIESVRFLISRPERTADPLPNLPILELTVAYSSMILLLIGVPFGMLQTLRKFRGDSLTISMVSGSTTLFVAFIVRFTSSRGGEILSRTWPFLYVVIGFVLAVGILYLTDLASWIKWPMRLGVFCAIIVLFVGGIASGWPPYWARLPGNYLVGAAERSVDIYGLTASTWARDHIKQNSIMASDLMLHHMLGSYGMQAPILGMGDLFLNESFSEFNYNMINEYALEYLIVDKRMADAVPTWGFYYGSWEPKTTKAVPLRYITKYDLIPSVNRIYDNGAVIFYDVRNLLEP
jgi:hypothetical protein